MTADKRTTRTKVGVIGVGSMGQHHARVYSELSDSKLVGISDKNHEQGVKIANEHGTVMMDRPDLLKKVDAVSVAVPTKYHYQTALECIDHDVDMLIEKPFVSDPKEGADLIKLADQNNVTMQVGHIERFNPAITTLCEMVSNLQILSVRAQRLGPPPERKIGDSAVLDLMIHDIDIVLALLDMEPTSVNAVGVRKNKHATATLQFSSDTMATLVASRATQRKIRTLEITAEDCFVVVDYIDKTIEIHRRSVPEYIKQKGDIHYRHQGIIEQPMVGKGEPLKHELKSFVDMVKNDSSPLVTAEQGLRAVKLAQQIETLAQSDSEDSIEVVRF